MTANRIECKRCGGMPSLSEFKRGHIKPSAMCLASRGYRMFCGYIESYGGMVRAGKHWALLDKVGLCKWWPLGKPEIASYLPRGDGWEETVTGVPERYDGEEQHSRLEDCAVFVAVAPIWAVELAVKLGTDELARKLGGRTTKRKQLARRGFDPKQRIWVSVDKVVQKLTMAERVDIMHLCRHNEMAREFINDDVEAFVKIMRANRG